jgi:alkyl hydroperoxide reductase subunit D
MSQTWVEVLQESIPEYAKDVRLNLDAVINRSTGINPDDAMYISLACSVASGNPKLTAFIAQYATDETDRTAALTAGALMAQNNTWYPFLEMVGDPALTGLPAQLRMNAMANHGGTEKTKFEGYSLAASIIGKCPDCVKSHYESLKQLGYQVHQLRDIGRIAATINAVSKVLAN